MVISSSGDARPARASTTRPPNGGQRSRAIDGHAVAAAARREVVEDRLVLRAAVVPERDRVRLPPEAAHEARILDVPVQHLEQRIALLGGQRRNVRREDLVDEEQLATRFRDER